MNRPILLLLGLLAVLALVLGSAVRPVWTIDPDASLYVGLGRALAAGEGYALDGIPHTKYPPGLPLLLALLARLGGPEAYGLFHGALVVALLAAVALTFSLVRRLGYPPAVALAVAALVGCSQTLFDLSVVYVRTEVLFLALGLGALLVGWRALGERGSALALLLATLLTVAAIATRLAGVALLAVPALHLLRPSSSRGVRVRAFALLVLCALPLVAWQVRAARITAEVPGATDYGTEFLAAEPHDLSKTVRVDVPRLDAGSLARRVAGNVEVMTRASATLLSNVDRAAARLPVGMLTMALVLAGLHVMWWRHGGRRERADATAWALALIGLTLIWPFNQQERFYVPLLPVLLIAAGEGLLLLWSFAQRLSASSAGRRLVLGAGLLVLAGLALQRSDHPTVFGRWSNSYVALLGLLGLLWVGTAWLLRRGALPSLGAGALLLAALALAVPWAHKRFVAWPARAEAFDARRAADPQPGALASIEVDPLLETVAVWLRDTTPPDTLVMTDVPAMLQAMCERRCIPYVFRVDPPEVLHGEADLVFYTRELANASAVMDAVAADYDPVFSLPIGADGAEVPVVFRPSRQD